MNNNSWKKDAMRLTKENKKLLALLQIDAIKVKAFFAIGITAIKKWDIILKNPSWPQSSPVKDDTTRFRRDIEKLIYDFSVLDALSNKIYSGHIYAARNASKKSNAALFALLRKGIVEDYPSLKAEVEGILSRCTGLNSRLADLEGIMLREAA